MLSCCVFYLYLYIMYRSRHLHEVWIADYLYEWMIFFWGLCRTQRYYHVDWPKKKICHFFWHDVILLQWNHSSIQEIRLRGRWPGMKYKYLLINLILVYFHGGDISATRLYFYLILEQTNCSMRIVIWICACACILSIVLIKTCEYACFVCVSVSEIDRMWVWVCST